MAFSAPTGTRFGPISVTTPAYPRPHEAHFGRGSTAEPHVGEGGHQRGNGRSLERWPLAGLGPPEQASFQQKLDHFRQLAAISRSGVDADVTARRLAARGLVCERLRPAILRELGISQLDEGEVVVEFAPDPSTDSGFDAIDRLASAMDKDTKGLPPLFVRIIKAFKRNARRRAAELGRSADDVFHSFLVNGLCHVMGADIYDPDAFAAVFNVDASEIPPRVIDEINAKLSPSARDIDNAYRNVPLERIVAVAQRLTELAPHLLEYLEIKRASDAEIEDLAATFAPLVSYYLDLLRDAYDDFLDNELAPGALELTVAQN